MVEYTLVVGNKNYSSWSMRGWLAIRQAGVPFEEVVVPLDRPETRDMILRYSPSGKVPVLLHGGRVVWDSLAIVEYLAERAPDAGLWPGSADARAAARSVCAEMHAGFQALRSNMPMNIRASRSGEGRAPGVDADVARIGEIWQDCRQRFGDGGPFLFGAWSAADSFFAPVVTRFRTYGVGLDPVCTAYVDRVMAWPAVTDWCEAARAESWSIPRFETA